MATKKTKPKTGKKPSTGRKQGAQPNNKNALKHGFYSEGWTEEEIKRLGDAEELDLMAEIQLTRIMIDRLKAQINFNIKNNTDAQLNTRRDEHYLQQLNTLTAMAQSQATLVRTQYLIKGKAGDLQSSILQALEELRLEMGL